MANRVPEEEINAWSVAIFMLKEQATDGRADPYQQYFDHIDRNPRFKTFFVPVLDFSFIQSGLEEVVRLLKDPTWYEPCGVDGSNFTPIIFTSKRAVDAYGAALDQLRAQDWEFPSGKPPLNYFTVGGATENAIKRLISAKYEWEVLPRGAGSGNGENLARYIKDRYEKDPDCNNPSFEHGVDRLLFLTGEKHHDSISRILNSESHNPVQEIIVYRAGERTGFKTQLTSAFRNVADRTKMQWIAIFSPTACKTVLELLGRLLDGTDQGRENSNAPRTFIAAIGPTTRDHLRTEFGCIPDAVAAKPNPEELHKAIADFITSQDLMAKFHL